MNKQAVKILFCRVHGRDYRNLPGCLLRGHGQWIDAGVNASLDRLSGSQRCEGVFGRSQGSPYIPKVMQGGLIVGAEYGEEP